LSLGGGGEAVVVEAEAGAEGAVAKRGDFPAAGAGDFGDEAGHVEAFQASSEGGSAAATLVRVTVILVQPAAEVGIAKAVELVFAAQHSAEELDVVTMSRVETGVTSLLFDLGLDPGGDLLRGGRGVVDDR
jgi:hypothetical protein